jgi:hypothetical protein
MHLILDCDPLVYGCGFSAETTAYHLVTEDQETGEIAEAYFAPYDGKTSGSRMQKYLQDNPQLEVIEKERRVIPDTEENAIAAVRTKLFSIEKEIREHYAIDNLSQITTVLSGPGNYREALATRFPYKGNRDPLHKPYWYQAIRNYITGSWGAIVVSGREADDECSIIARKCLANGEDYIIATIDKDLDQIPGKHFNYLKRVFYAVSESESRRFFWEQCLSGDATDGIPGCWKLGTTGAQRLVERTYADIRGSADSAYSSARGNAAVSADESAYLYSKFGNNRTAEPSNTRNGDISISNNRRDTDDRAMWAAIVAAYEASTTKAACPYSRSEAPAVALESARLVYLQHVEGELWTPPGEPKQWLPGYEPEKDE